MTDDPLVGYYKLQLATISNQSVRKSGSPLLNIFEAVFFVLSVSDTINLKRLRPAITKVPSFYLTGDRYLSVLHAKIRNKCSNLNNDLFNNHLSPTPLCNRCQETEDAEHFSSSVQISPNIESPCFIQYGHSIHLTQTNFFIVTQI